MNLNCKFAVYCDNVQDTPLICPNYGVFDRKGNYYFSDSGDDRIPNGRLIRVPPIGKPESLIGGNWHFPNGLAISPKDGSIFVIESQAADILRIPIDKNGKAGAPEIYVRLQGNELDGLAFARNGNLYVSCYYPNRIYVVSTDRNMDLLIEDSVGDTLNQPTNIAFEPNGTRLFFSNLAGQHVGALDVGERGAPLHYPKL
jgi:gluconolactonase